jgi:Tfp pilus assembly protein PilN
MIRINLLPKEMRKAHGIRIPKSVLIGAGAAAAVVLVLAGLTAYQAYRLNQIDGQIADVQRQADRMRDDIILVDRLVDVKTKILARLAAIEKLDRGRERWVSILDELSNRVPEFLWLSSFRPTGPKPQSGGTAPTAAANQDSTGTKEERLAIEGYSFTLNGLANFLLELKASDYFDQIGLNFAKIVALDNHAVYNFSLNCRLLPDEAVGQANNVEKVTAAMPPAADRDENLAVRIDQ